MNVVKTQEISPRLIEKVIVHPLVLRSIVDNYNGVAKDTRKRVVGVLLGSSFKGTVNVTNSYEVPFEEDEKDPSIWFLDHNYHESMFSMFKRISAKEHVVGWYSTCSKLQENDLDIHGLINGYVPNPVLVIIDVQPKELGIPTKAYCAIEEVKEDATQKSQKVFVHVPSEIAAHEVKEIDSWMDSTASNIPIDSNTSLESESAETSILGPATTMTNDLANATANVPSDVKKPPSGKLGSLTSKVWEHFTRLSCRSRADQKASCNYCGKIMKCPSTNGTTVLHNHTYRCPKYPLNELDENQKTLMFEALSDDDRASGNGSSIVTWKFDQETCRKYCARMIILGELPFRMVEHEGFREFCRVMQPRFQVPLRFTTAKDCYDLFLSKKEKLFMYLKRSKLRVCLTTDIWTSRQNLNYMCLTVHFIDQKWKLHKRILSFTPIPNHSGEIIGKCIEKHLLEWGIDQVLTITVDNASSNDLGIQYVKRRLNNWNGSILKSEYLHMRCCVHIFSLIVKEGLNDLDDSIFRIRSAVRYVRSSPGRLQRFKICVEQEKITSKSLVYLDVETRWNSTFLMLEAALKFQTAFDRLEEQDDKYREELTEEKNRGLPTRDDWDFVRGLLPFLKSFYDSTLRVSGSSYVTSNNYFHMVFSVGMQINDKMNDLNPNIKLMASRMKQKFEKYWGNVKNLNPLLFIAAILDPRCKMDYAMFVIDEVYDEENAVELGNRVKVTLNALFEHYASIMGNFSEEASASSQAPIKLEEAVDVNDVEAYVLSKYKRRRVESQCKEGKSELERYLEDIYEQDDKNFDILLWWKVNGHKYPILATMARDLLAIPLSTVTSDSAFSTGRRMLDPFRSSLTPKIVEALICTQNWLESTPELIENEEKLNAWEDIECNFKELILNETRMVIDD